MILSPRQEEVARLVAAGLTDQQIGRQMQISESTVKSHLHNVFQLTGCRSRAGLVGWLFAQCGCPCTCGVRRQNERS